MFPRLAFAPDAVLDQEYLQKARRVETLLERFAANLDKPRVDPSAEPPPEWEPALAQWFSSELAADQSAETYEHSVIRKRQPYGAHFTNSYSADLINLILSQGLKAGSLNGLPYFERSLISYARLGHLYFANRSGLGIVFRGEATYLSPAEAQERFGVTAAGDFIAPEQIEGVILSFWVPQYNQSGYQPTKRSHRVPLLIWPPLGSPENEALSKKMGIPLLPRPLFDQLSQPPAPIKPVEPKKTDRKGWWKTLCEATWTLLGGNS